MHLLGDLRAVLQICSNKIEPQGFFAFCSGYTSRMFSEDTEGKAMEMILKIREVGRKEFRAHFSAQSRRDVPENRIHMVAIDPLEQTLLDNGFSLKTLEFQKCLLDRASIVNFMVLPGVGDSILPETIPVDDRRRIIGNALEVCEIDQITRNWCFAVAQKK